jgi:Flp pilus assembly pilin Flp
VARTHVHRSNVLSIGPAAFYSFPESETGGTAVEYSLLVAFIATVIISVVQVLGDQLIPGFQAVIDLL